MAELPDPSDLTDEQLDKLLETGQLPDEEEEKPDDKEDKPEEKEDPKEDKPDEEDKPEDEADDKPDDKPDEEDAPDEAKPKDERKPSRREQLRIRNLLEKYGNPEDKPEPKPKADGIDYEKELDADPELIKKLEADRKAVSEDSFSQGLEQMKSVQFLTRLEIDAPRVESKYPQLNKDSEEFKPEAATDVNLLYLQLAGYDHKTKSVKNPEVRYSEFVDTIFGLANDLADVKVEKQVKEVKKQAAQTGIRPDGSRTKKLDLTKAPEDMTDEELDAYLAQAIPKR